MDSRFVGRNTGPSVSGGVKTLVGATRGRVLRGGTGGGVVVGAKDLACGQRRGLQCSLKSGWGS